MVDLIGKGGQIRTIAQGATCGPNEQLITLGGGSIAGADFHCSPQTILPSTPIGFQPNVSFGTSIAYNAAGPSPPPPVIQVLLNGAQVGMWPVFNINPNVTAVAGNRLISVQAGDSLSLVSNDGTSVPSPAPFRSLLYSCDLVITQVQ